jgi:NAD(P)-dependent dehydrogenase (short-subunit alcohol dehydrogenase family)
MLFRLDGKRAIVTGATRGIGKAIATELARAGARVVVSSNEPDECAQVEKELRSQGFEAVSTPCDVAVDGDLEKLVARALDALGGVDILVCNAGVARHHGPAAQTSDQAYDETMRINARSPFKLCNLVAPLMAGQHDGSIIIISSLAGLRGNRAIAVYAMSKAASAQLARNLAVEWGPMNVRANAISPGLVETDFARPILGDAERLTQRIRQTPLRRVGTPTEIAGCVVFLASPAGAFVTGHNLVCDGGTLIAD